MADKPQPEKSLYARVVGRSLLSVVFGRFFESKNNTAAIIGLLLVLTLCYAIVFKEKYEYMNGVLNIVFVVIGYYFGAKQAPAGNEDDEAA
jgi:hypothetical protein